MGAAFIEVKIDGLENSDNHSKNDSFYIYCRWQSICIVRSGINIKGIYEVNV